MIELTIEVLFLVQSYKVGYFIAIRVTVFFVGELDVFIDDVFSAFHFTFFPLEVLLLCFDMDRQFVS